MAALQETLRLELEDPAAANPAHQMAMRSREEIEKRAEKILTNIAGGGVKAALVEGYGAIGGGSSPKIELPSLLIEVQPSKPEHFLAALRELEVPVVPRIDNGRIWFDVRTVDPGDDGLIISAILRAWSQ